MSLCMNTRSGKTMLRTTPKVFLSQVAGHQLSKSFDAKYGDNGSVKRPMPNLSSIVYLCFCMCFEADVGLHHRTNSNSGP